MVPASQAIRDAIVDRRLTLPPDRVLALHASHAVMRTGRRGWRLDKPDRAAPIDALVALCMALERAQQPPPEPVRLLGWL